jgi:hypothetical protein
MSPRTSHANVLVGKVMIQPMIVTNRLQPMGVHEVRRYYAKLEEFPDIPVVIVEEFLNMLRNN